MDQHNRLQHLLLAKYGWLQSMLWFSVSLLVVTALVHPVAGHDGWVHLNWLEQFTALFRSGEFYPRWMPESFAGYGSPAFYFYPPLSYWYASVWSFVTTDPSILYYIVSLSASILSAFTMHRYCAAIGIIGKPATLAALLYGFGLYRFVDVFVRNAFGEQFAFIFLPVIFMGIEASASDRKRSFVLFTLGWSGLLLSNLPSGIITVVACIVYGLSMSRRVALIPLVSGVVVTAAMTALYWLPILSYYGDIQPAKLMGFRSNLIGGGEHLDTFASIYFDLRIANIVMVLTSILLLAPLVHLVRHRNNLHRRRATVVLTLLCTGLAFQIPVVGTYIHQHVFPFTFIQLYFRWNLLLTFGSAVAVAFLVRRHAFVVISSVSTLALATIAVAYISFQTHTVETPNPLRFDVAEYLPREVPEYDSTALRKLITMKTSATRLRANMIALEPRESLDHIVTIPLYYWRNWLATDNEGRAIPLRPDTKGRVTAQLSGYSNALYLTLKRGTAEYAGSIISAMGLVAFLLVVTRKKINQCLKV